MLSHADMNEDKNKDVKSDAAVAVTTATHERFQPSSSVDLTATCSTASKLTIY